ncbi:hypothetical protein OF001_U230011 [Pseudomonas sp. OF001]|nr:hypothetical protein OF001_U230011 [Pseudomonas sp. OF001]
MTDGPAVDQLATPLPGQAGHRFEAGQVIVAAGRDHARERQRTGGKRIPAVGAQGFRGRVALRPLGVQIRRRGQQRAFDVMAVAGRPVRHHQHAGAVRYQDHRAVDLRQLALDRLDPRGAAELVGLQRRHRAHPGQAGLQQRLPVLGHMVAQAGNDQDGCGGLQFFHVSTIALDIRVGQPADCLRSTVKSAPPTRFTFRDRQFSFDDRRIATHPTRHPAAGPRRNGRGRAITAFHLATPGL